MQLNKDTKTKLYLFLGILFLLLAFWSKNRVRTTKTRLPQLLDERHLVHLRRISNMHIPPTLRSVAVYHHHRHTFRQTAFQDGKTGSRSVRQKHNDKRLIS